MDERREELHGFTVDRIKQLCMKVHIKSSGKTKEDLIAQLLEVESREMPGAIGGETSSLSAQLLEMVMQIDAEGPASLARGTADETRGADGAKSAGSKRDGRGCASL